MKNVFKKLFSKETIFYWVLIIFLGANQIYTQTKNAPYENKTYPSVTAEVISGKGEVTSVTFPPKGRAIAIFWSTTCPPCKVEMARLKSSVEDGKIPQEKIFAIDSFENALDIKKFLKKSPHPFTFIQDPGFSRALNIRATPTTIFLEDGKVLSISTGLSVIGIWKAEQFLKS